MAKMKLQITMDEELLKDLDKYCEANYMNRSWAISQGIVQLINQQKIVDSMYNVSVAVRRASENGNIDEETKKEIETFETLTKMFAGK